MDKTITIKNSKLRIILLFLLSLTSSSFFGQDAPDFYDDVNDVPPPTTAPIDNWIPLLLIVAVIIAYRITSRIQIKE